MDTKEMQPATSELPPTEPTLCEGSESSGQKGIVKLGRGRKRVSFRGNYSSSDSEKKVSQMKNLNLNLAEKGHGIGPWIWKQLNN